MRARPHRGGIGLHWRPNFAFLVVLAQEKKVPVASHQTRARELQAVASAVRVLGKHRLFRGAAQSQAPPSGRKQEAKRCFVEFSL